MLTIYSDKQLNRTIFGWEIMMTCDPSASVIVAPARSAMRRSTSVPAALSPVGTTAQDGKLLHAGDPVRWLNPSAETGR